MQVGALGLVGFVGRQPELGAISAAANAAADYRPSVVWVEGDAGLGKTWLLRHALRNLTQDFTIVAAEADEFASDMSFNLLEQLGVPRATAVFPAGLKLLEYLGRLQSTGPVVVAVEDLPLGRSGVARCSAGGRPPAQSRQGGDDCYQPTQSSPRRWLGTVPVRPEPLPCRPYDTSVAGRGFRNGARRRGQPVSGLRRASVPPHRRTSSVRPDPAQRVLSRSARQRRRQPSCAPLFGLGHGGPFG